VARLLRGSQSGDATDNRLGGDEGC
jgi:hypothetical protein